MRQDWSWTQSAKKYVDLYQTTITRASQTQIRGAGYERIPLRHILILKALQQTLL